MGGNGAGPVPPSGPAPPPEVEPAATGAPEGRPPGTNVVPGVPGILQRPSERPGEPVWTPPAEAGTFGPTATNLSAAQQRIAALDALRRSPEVSPETREWASVVLATLLDQPLPLPQ
jgi:hypothetical protein